MTRSYVLTFVTLFALFAAGVTLYVSWSEKREGRKAALERVELASALASAAPDSDAGVLDLPASYLEAAPRLLPAVKEHSFFDLLEMQLAEGGALPAAKKLARRPLTDRVYLALAYDGPSAMSFVTSGRLDAWNTTPEDAFAVAAANLAKKSSEPFLAPAPGLYRSPWQDDYDAARLALPDLLEKLQVKGDTVAMAPNRETLLVAGSNDDDALVGMAELAEKALAEPRAMAAVALRLDHGGWSPFLPPASFRSYLRLKKLVVEGDTADYEAQKVVLEARNQRDGAQVIVAPLVVAKDRVTGAPVTYAAWVKGVEALLPRADYVVLVDLGHRAGPVAAGPWERVKEVAGDAMRPLGVYPERFDVNTFPAPAALARIGNDAPFDPR